MLATAGLLATSGGSADPTGRGMQPAANELDAPRSEGRLQWRAGDILLPALEPEEATAAIDGVLASGQRHFVLQFNRPLTPQRRSRLASAGVRLLNYVGDNAFFASADAARYDAAALAGTRTLRWASRIVPTWKRAPSYDRGEVFAWTIVSVAKDPLAGDWNEQRLPGDEVTPDDNPIVGAYVLFHADVNLDQEGRGLALLYGATIRSEMRSVNGLVLELAYADIFELAAEDAVQWIEPPLPKMSPTNDSNRAITGAEVVQQAPYGLDGTGVTVLVYDGGTALASHSDFGGRLTARDSSGLSSHATHTSGTVGGDGSGSGGLYRGMAPGVTIESYGFEQPGGLQQGFLYTDPGDLEQDYGEAITLYGADISNDSIGTNTAANGFPCDWEGNYGATAALIDSIARGFFGEPFRIVWSNGNERGSGRCGTTYHTTAPPACAKNHITVGALNSNDDSVTSFTSWGDTDDGRIKPDLAGPGCQSNGDGGVTSCNSSGGYSTFCGTSMSGPTVCGLGALLLQDFRQQYPGDPDFRGSTLKAILAHTAIDIEQIGPDFKTGYGSVRIQPAVDLMRAGNFLEDTVDQGQVFTVLGIVGPSDTQLKVTLAWDDVPGTPNVNPVLVNDLDLHVYDSADTRYFPWTLDPANPSVAAVRIQEDHLNNIEQVVIDNPPPGAYRIEIHGFNVPSGPQPFSITVSPELVACASAGFVALDSSKYPCGATATLTVIDCDLNTDSLVVESVNVTVTSDSEPAGEIVTLTETAPETAKFIAALPLALSDAVGTLLIADGDAVTATYVDADDGQGGLNVVVNANATVDCQPPVIFNVQVINLGPRDATITFDADEPVSATIRYGASCATLDSSVAAIGFQASRSIHVTGLTDDTSYFFAIDASDEAGNAMTDDNGGSCFGFATPQIPDFFTEQFAADNDLSGWQLIWTPAATVDQYAGCAETLTGGLPIDPTGGTTLPLSDDGSAQVTLGGGAQVQLYGTAYSSFYVNANGNITFNSADGTFSESLGQHFGQPRVSGLFDDLNPATGGIVSWMQLVDRVVVTWENVPEFSTSNQNTFQIELHFDGEIRVNYAALAATDGVVGLSAGNGQDPDFFETDLSAQGPCGPRPPTADDAAAETVRNTPVLINLTASDDGLPVPAQLDLIIVSLPAHGALNDPGAGQIIGVPYTLVGGGAQVEYVPNPGYAGFDGFTFKANDGGTPPAGGDSNVATVSIDVAPSLPIVLHDFPLDSNPGWTVESQWGWGKPWGQGSHNLDPLSGHTGAFVYGYNLFGDYGLNLSEFHLTSGPLDVTNHTRAELRFWRWLGIEDSAFDHARVSVSNDGSTWIDVWIHDGPAIEDLDWVEQVLDISAVADNQPTVYVRWTMGTTDGATTYPGWNIDDIRILGVPPTPPLFGDVNGDCVVNVTDLAIVLGEFGRSDAGVTADVDGDGDVDLADLAGVLGAFGTFCP